MSEPASTPATTPAAPRPPGGTPRQLWVIAAIAFLLNFPIAVAIRAQDRTPPAGVPTPGVPSIATGEIDLGLDAFGVGNQARLGDWAAIRLRVLDKGSQPRNVLLRLSTRDADGDRPEYERVIAANPGVAEGPWLYARLPFDLSISGSTGLVASAYEALEPTPGVEASGTGFRPGRLLARSPLMPKASQVVPSTMGIIAVIDSLGRTAGLDAYARIVGPTQPWSPGRHEATEVLSLRAVADLPDRWFGLEPLESIVWLSADPVELRGDRARALREWVNHGGHLIISIPPVGQTWTNPASNELFDLLPVATLTRHEGVDLEPLRPLLVGSKTVRVDTPGERGRDTTDQPVKLPRSAILHTFTPHADARPGEAVRILNTPDGSCVVMRRLVGQGAVTLVGIDLSAPGIAQGVGVDATAFWHRVLGKRGTFIRPTDQSALAAAGMGAPQRYDRDIPAWLRDSGKSAAGVLLALILFAAYWLLAGPLGFAFIRRRGIARVAWVAFLGVAAVFTAIAWGSATVLRPKAVVARHLTILDHVYGQPIERARGWFGVLLPTYGDSLVCVGDPKDAQSEQIAGKNLLAPWDDAGEPRSQRFPNARAYPTDTKSPDALRVPARATVKELVAEWAGGPPWEMPRPINPDGSVGAIAWAGGNESTGPGVRGVLRHQLPGTLKDVCIVLIRRQESLGVNARENPVVGAAASYSEWPPGTDLDLGVVFNAPSTRDAAIGTFLQRLRPTTGIVDDALSARPGSDLSPDTRLLALSFFAHIQPPELPAGGTFLVTHGIAQRASTHTYDLGRWFTQPCLIIVGTLGKDGDGAPSPIPLTVDGEPARTRGRTIVRWIYPLPDQPPPYVAAEMSSSPLPEEPRGR